MKRFLTILLAVLGYGAMLCTGALAADYAIPGTDMTIGLEDSAWYVFTRENLEGNPQLAELGIDPQQLESELRAQSIYLEALYFREDGAVLDLVVGMNPSDKVVNLSNYSDSELDELGDQLVQKAGSDGYTLYKTDYTYVRLDSVDGQFYLRDYVTVINKQTYTIKFQSVVPFDQEMRSFADEIVDNVRFDVDHSMKEYEPGFFETVAGRSLIAGAIGGAAGGVISVVGKKRKAKKENEPSQTPEE